MSDQKGKILVVDDDPNLLSLLTDTLTSFGHEVVAADDGIRALELLGPETDSGFDLMITDVKMPNVDGISLLKRVRRHFPDMPVLFITGVAEPEMVAEASPDGFLAKPFRISQLEAMVDNALAARGGTGQPRHMCKVLLNLQDEPSRDILSRALTYKNYLPFSVADGAGALEELERGEFDVLVTRFEDTDADRDLVRRIQIRYPSLLTVLVSSSYTDEDVPGLSEHMRVDGLVSRPFKVRALVELIDCASRPLV
ncbi:MAG: response regulator [candidate division Zixibacteria bacterium]|nr:response regulator [candidate division Zixibacteria bacterium]